jgi:hypothetical protein
VGGNRAEARGEGLQGLLGWPRRSLVGERQREVMIKTIAEELMMMIIIMMMIMMMMMTMDELMIGEMIMIEMMVMITAEAEAAMRSEILRLAHIVYTTSIDFRVRNWK